MRRALENLFAFLLGHAAQHAKPLALGQQLLVVRQPVKNFLLRLIPDGARVVKNQVRLLDGLHLSVALVHQCANDFFRVMHVHLAAEGFEVEGLVGVRSHIQSQYKRCQSEMLVWVGHSCPTLLWVGVAPALNTVGLGWAGQIRVVTSLSGSSEVSATSPNSKSNLNPNINSKVKGVGQECPTHTSKPDINSRSHPNINGKIKGVGQECPTHTGLSYFPADCSTQSHL